MKRLAAAFRVAPALLTLAACTLHRLPEPSIPSCPTAGAPSLWQCLDGIPRDGQPESGFTSTFRVSDTSRKQRDQGLPAACEGPTPPGFELRRVDMDAGRAPLVALVAPPSDPSSPIVMVVHGLFDSKYTQYVEVTGELFQRQGFGVVLPDMRFHGCLLSRQWLPTLGVDEGPDLLAWGRWLAREHPGHPIGLVGFSLGGLDVLHAMGQPGADEVFTAGAVAVSPAADLPRLVQYLDAKVYFADAGYSKSFRMGFRSLLRKRAKELGMTAEGSFAGTVEFLVSERPELGPTPAEFLDRADPSPSVATSRQPLLILVTSNDPIIPVSSISELDRAAEGNPLVHMIETPFGGHIGQPGHSPQWFASILATFFRYSVSAAAGGPSPSCEQPAGGLDAIQKQRMAGDLDAARIAARSTLECTSTAERQVELLVEIARIEDRIGLHRNTRPVPEALAAIERADRIAETSGLRSKAAVELARAEYFYRAELSGRELRSAERHAETAAALFQELGDEHGQADAVHLLGLIHFQRGGRSPGRELEQAVELFEWSLALDRAGGQRVWFLGEYHRHVGYVALAAGDSASAVSHFEQSLVCRKEAGAFDAALFAAQTLGSTLVQAGRAEQAREPLQYGWVTAERLDSPVGMAQVQTALGDMYRALGNRSAARDAYRRALDAAAKVDYRPSITAAEAALESLSAP